MTLLVLFRCTHYLCLMILFGVSLLRPRLAPPSAVLPLRRLMDPFLCLVALFALLSGVGWLLATSAQFSGSWVQGVQSATLRGVLFGTFFGKVWGVHLILCLVQLVYWRLPGRRSHTPALALSTLALATMAPVGHVAMFTGIEGGLMVLNQMLHLLCAGAWLGGLFLLLWMSFKPQLVDLKSSMQQFSRLGVPLVVVILISGAINTRLITGEFLPSGSAFATVLAVKATAVLAMLGLALYNRYQASRIAPVSLRTALIAEALCGVAALAAVAWLGTLAPMPMGAT